jgi:hypothetical protein
MTKMALSLRNIELTNKIDKDTAELFVDRALKNKYDDCIQYVRENKDMMDKLDEDTKNKI